MSKQSQAKTKRTNKLPKSRSQTAVRNSLTLEDKRDLRDARRSLKETSEKGSKSWEQVKRELGI